MTTVQKIANFFLSDELALYLRAKDKKPTLLQISELFRLYAAYRFIPYHYFKHGLYQKSFNSDLCSYVPPELLQRFRDQQNPRDVLCIADDKKQFQKVMARAGLPVTCDFLLVFKNGEIRNSDSLSIVLYQDAVRSLPPSRSFFAKPAGGGGGKCVFRLEVCSEGFVHRGSVLTENEFFSLLFSEETPESWTEFLIQEDIVQHPILAGLNSSCVNTVRIDTLLIGGKVQHSGALLKLGSGTNLVDNWWGGGAIIRIDLETGKLGSTGKLKAKFGGGTQTRHPVSGTSFEGITIPFWDEVKDLASRGAVAIQPLRAIGWDIAITPNGPLLVEANHDFNIFMMQEGVGGLRDTPLGSLIN